MNRPKLESAFGAMSPFSKQVQTQDDLLEDGQVVDNSNLDDAPIVPRKQAQQLSQQDIVTDIDYTRRTLQFTVERAQQLVDLALANAADASSPRDIEVAANALNTCANVSERLINLYSSIKNLTEKSNTGTGSGNTVINQNKTVVLSSSDLLKQLIDTENL